VDDDRWIAHRREHALEKEALTVAASAQQRALDLARQDINRRLEGMNELRQQITSERGNFISRAEYEAKHEQVTERLQIIETNQASLLSRLTVVAALAGVAVSVIVSFVLKALNV
jgi:hypothetical protein